MHPYLPRSALLVLRPPHATDRLAPSRAACWPAYPLLSAWRSSHLMRRQSRHARDLAVPARTTCPEAVGWSSLDPSRAVDRRRPPSSRWPALLPEMAVNGHALPNLRRAHQNWPGVVLTGLGD